MISMLRRTALLAIASVFLISAAEDISFDVRNGDQKGRLTLKETELSFESLTDAKQSRTWKYAEIRTFEKKWRGFRVRPFKGSRYDFQVGKERDRIYDLIAERVLAARQTKK